MAYVSWAIILGYVLLEFRYRIKAVGAFVVGIGFIAMGAASLLPYRYQTAEPLVPALNSYWIYIHIRNLTSYAAFAMAGGLGFDVSVQGTGGESGQSVPFLCGLPDLETIDELGYKAIMLGFPLLAFGIILRGHVGQLRLGRLLELGSKRDLVVVDRMAHLRRLYPCPHDAWGEGHKAAIYAIFGFLMVIFCFWE